MGKSEQSKTIIVLIVLFAMGICPNSEASILYVDDTATGLNDGSSWENAYVYLQDALAVAISSDEVRVAQGTYKPDSGGGNTPGDQQATFQLIDEVTIKGGYAGHGQTDPNQRDVILYESLLSGDLNSDDDPNSPFNDSDNSDYIIKDSFTNETAILDGFTIISAGGNHISGKSMLNEFANPTIMNCKFLINSDYPSMASQVFNNNSNPVFINCIFESTSTFRHFSLSSGIIENTASSPIFGYCTFKNNGTAMLNEDGSNPVLSNCNLIDNDLGILNRDNSSPSINNCIFENNEAGIRNFDSSPVLADCVFKNNNDTALENDDSTVILYDSIFSDNSVDHHSLVSGGNLTLYNCVFSGNSLGSSILDSIIDTSDYLELHNCIFSGNSGSLVITNNIRGNIYNSIFYGNKNSTITIGRARQIGAIVNANLTGCIIWGNTFSLDNNINVTYSNIQGGFAGQGNIDIDPLFAVPGYWADENDTDIIIDANNPNAVWIEGDYHLKSQAGRWDPTIESWVQDDVTSPCIDAGDPMDQLGPEPFPNGAVYNMGTYGRTEKASKSYFGSEPLGIIIPGDINGDGIVNTTDLEIVVNHWLMKAEDFILTNEPPTVTLLSPQEGEQIVWPGPTLFMAEASDSDGQVVNVYFKLEYKDENIHSSSTFSSTYIDGFWQNEHDWRHREDGPFGTWTAWAEATDDKGAKSESEKIQITLSSPD